MIGYKINKESAEIQKQALSDYLHNLAEAVKLNDMGESSLGMDVETQPLRTEEGIELKRFITAKNITIKLRLVAKPGQELKELTR